jgi:hypothetical protein
VALATRLTRSSTSDVLGPAPEEASSVKVTATVEVSCAVGGCEGRGDGSEVGCGVGSLVGSGVGTVVGAGDGGADGCPVRVGKKVGCGVGSVVGLKVGLGEGCGEGAEVGLGVVWDTKDAVLTSAPRAKVVRWVQAQVTLVEV